MDETIKDETIKEINFVTVDVNPPIESLENLSETVVEKVSETVLDQIVDAVIKEKKSILILAIESCLESVEKQQKYGVTIDDQLKSFFLQLIATKNTIFKLIEEDVNIYSILLNDFPKITILLTLLYKSVFKVKSKSQNVDLCGKTLKVIINIALTEHISDEIELNQARAKLSQMEQIVDTAVDLIKLNKTIKVEETLFSSCTRFSFTKKN